ncbi:MAG TPA: hypothetical protein VH722_02055 [Alphaproteobacteria bacterium]|jgi:hypothetical protein|nr:hypothetical protein [Alphaproteobacteria bacterium]
MIRLRILALIMPIISVPLLLAACDTTGVFPSQSGRAWKDADTEGVPLQKGAGQCKDQAKLNAKIATGVAQQAEVAGDLYEQCMVGRGY